jgi:hypothetical protein
LKRGKGGVLVFPSQLQLAHRTIGIGNSFHKV